MAESETTIPSTCVATCCPKWTLQYRPQPRTEDPVVSKIPPVTHTQPTLCQWSQSQTTLKGTALAENSAQPNNSDCVICGKWVQQIPNETVNEYLDRTVVLGETLPETEARRAFLDGMWGDVPFYARRSVAGYRLR